jgi:1,4-alpha-glucan branching enzyme
MITRGKPGKNGLVRIVFTLPAEVGGPTSVVGDFNDWDPHAHPMASGADGRPSVTIEVPQGLSFAFRYLREGGVWFDDPDADEHDHRGGILHIPAGRTGARATRASNGSVPQPA